MQETGKWHNIQRIWIDQIVCVTAYLKEKVENFNSIVLGFFSFFWTVIDIDVVTFELGAHGNCEQKVV